MDAFIQETLARIVVSSFQTAPYWLTIVLGFAFWQMWLSYIHTRNIANLQWTMLEIKIPREISKSPLAMELVLNALYQKGSISNLLQKYVQGNLRPWFSLELVSLEGKVHFFIYTQKFFSKLIETQIYAQYPTVEVTSAEDYTTKIPYGHPGSDWQMWGGEFTLTKPDPYPIKTYVDYGLHKDPKEEFKIDPITPILEYLGSIGKGEQIWIQIMVRQAEERFKKPGTWFEKRGWKDEAKDLTAKLLKEAAERTKKLTGADKPGPIIQTKADEEVISAIERSTSKFGFDCGIRGVYLAREGVFNSVNVPGLVGSLRQFNSEHLNGFKPARTTSLDYPWQDIKNLRLGRMKARMFDAYRRRSYFYPPYDRKPFILNSEELATMYHFPGKVAETPSFTRIESRRAEPPQDLPI
ncbi:MAG: hypothetical protein HZC04_00675 [Candidatus Lloydbacteria bacterium]|nr:hypothetical protein [Candidatus Lloydbacteria bacterium]